MSCHDVRHVPANYRTQANTGLEWGTVSLTEIPSHRVGHPRTPRVDRMGGASASLCRSIADRHGSGGGGGFGCVGGNGSFRDVALRADEFGDDGEECLGRDRRFEVKISVGFVK